MRKMMMKGASGSFSPTNIANLHSWYDAADLSSIAVSGQYVSTWADKSGNNRNAVASVYGYIKTGVASRNGLNVLSRDAYSFLGVDAYGMVAPASISNNALTLFSVHHKPDVGGGGNFFSRVFSFNATNSVDYNNISSCLIYEGNTTPGHSHYFYRNSAANLTSAQISFAEPKLLNFALDNTAISLTVNGSTVTGTTSATSLACAYQKLFGFSDSFLNGWIAEQLVYTRVLSVSEKDAVNNYLKAKWGLP